ncbi:Phosphotransferase involved in threonylcarbamoyladenosine t(6)A37 formation in tRNA, partial [hydrothermal vent metagenome]
YLPHQNITVSDAFRTELLQAWEQVLDQIDGQNKVLVLRDFHAQNLIWLPKRAGHANVGLLDFQDAVFGHPAYDLVSLLQDARRDVSADLQSQMIDAFLQQAKITDKPAYLRAYRILGAQRAAKILGIFVRLAQRDHKPHYLDLLPRVEQYFIQNINQPELAPLRTVLRPVLPGLLGKQS